MSGRRTRPKKKKKEEEKGPGSCLILFLSVGGMFCVLLTLYMLQDQIFDLALLWPGGPESFVLSQAVIAPFAICLFTGAWTVRFAPEQGPAPLRRIPKRVLTVTGWTSITVCAVSALLLVSGIPSAEDPPCPSTDSLSCWVEANAPGTVLWAFLLGVSVLGAGCLILIAAFSTGADRRMRLTGCSITLGVLLLPLGTFVFVARLQWVMVPVAEHWPGGLHSFTAVLGLLVPVGLICAAIGWHRRSIMRPYAKAATMVTGGIVLALASLATFFVLHQAESDRDGNCSGALLPCALTDDLDTVNSATALGFGVAVISVLLLLIALMASWLRRTAPHRQGPQKPAPESAQRQNR